MLTSPGPLLESEVPAAPLEQFARWFAEAQKTAHPLPEGMTLATIDKDGRPAARVVLLKGAAADGLRFFTNYQSQKAAQLADRPDAALLFWWPEQQRQVRIEGHVEPLGGEENDRYHESRPRGSQVGAWASPQSSTVAGREELERRFSEQEARFAGGPVPRPPHWGGYLLVPRRWEFWQGRDNRMHDRLVYEQRGDKTWRLIRLAP